MSSGFSRAAGDISLIVLAAFWGLLVLFLALVLLTMFRVPRPVRTIRLRGRREIDAGRES